MVRRLFRTDDWKLVAALVAVVALWAFLTFYIGDGVFVPRGNDAP